MDKASFETKLTDVGKYYAEPKDLLSDKELTRAQKLKLLEQWDYDMQLLLTASEENMPNSDTSSSGEVAERVTALRKAMADLGAEHDPEAGGPGKVGAPVVETERRTASR